MTNCATIRKRNTPSSAPNSEAAEAILGIITRHANMFGPAAPLAGVHMARVRAALAAGTPLELVLPAFPAKSPNPSKTLGPLPDYAEVLGLERLEQLCSEITALHAPGAQGVICSDGRVFSDLVGVPDENVTAYGARIREILTERGLTRLTTFNMEDEFCGTFQSMRDLLEREFARPLDELRKEVRESAEARALFNGIHRFLFEDRLSLECGKSRNRVRVETKELAYRVIQRSNAWSALVAKRFPRAVRLSIHPQFPGSTKIGFQLVPCVNQWGTPWHNVALLGREGFRLVKRWEAEERGATLALAHGKYPYFREAGL